MDLFPRYPERGYNFLVFFDFLLVGGAREPFVVPPKLNYGHPFQSVDGIQLSMKPGTEMTDSNTHSYAPPSGVSSGDLTFKRGFVPINPIRVWIRRALEDFVITTCNVVIILINHDRVPTASWLALSCYPTSYSISGFDATQNQIVVESLTLKPKKIKMLTL